MHYVATSPDDDFGVNTNPTRDVTTLFNGETPPVLRTKAAEGVANFYVPFYFLQPSIAILNETGAPYQAGVDMTSECCGIVLKAMDVSRTTVFSEPFHTYRKLRFSYPY